jgi:hypothetical protein
VNVAGVLRKAVDQIGACRALANPAKRFSRGGGRGDIVAIDYIVAVAT